MSSTQNWTDSQFPFHGSPESRPKKIPKEKSGSAITLSLVVHLALLALLTFGINWRSSTPAGVEVELWDASLPTPIVEEPAPKLDLKTDNAEIALKKNKVIPPKEEPKVLKPAPPVPPKAKDAPKEAPKAAKPVATPPPPAAKANPATEKARADQLARLKAAAGAEGGSGGKVGSGVGGGGNALPEWADKIIRVVKPKITFNSASVVGNPACVVQVNLAPDGKILSRIIVKSSGVSEYDRAVLQALDNTISLPKDDAGLIPELRPQLTFKPKDN